MAENKTRPTDNNVDAFIDGIENEQQRADSKVLIEMMREISGHEPVLWGSIVGFGKYHYRYASGREGDMPLTGFSPRKQQMTVYVIGGFEDKPQTMEKLGKYKTGVGCLYFKKLSDLNEHALRELIKASVESAHSYDKS